MNVAKVSVALGHFDGRWSLEYRREGELTWRLYGHRKTRAGIEKLLAAFHEAKLAEWSADALVATVTWYD